MTRDAAAMAQACADAMWADDKASRTMGMQIEKVGPGFAVLSMSIGVGHGQWARSVPRLLYLLACRFRPGVCVQLA